MGPQVLPTDASRGFSHIAHCEGKPTGVPADVPGQVPMVMDTLAGILYIYVNQKWQPMGALGQDGHSIDAFARLRVSNPETLFESKQIFDNQPLFWDEELVSGGGISSAHSVNTASTVLTSTDVTAGDFIRQTFMRFNYQPGKSQLIFLTATGGVSGLEVVKRMGYFDDDNGIFVEDNGGVVNFVRRSNVTGSPVDEKVPSTEWNIDRFDGSGPSGITLDIINSQILIIDLEWLGVGRVRLGWVVDGIPYYGHEFLNANAIVGVYMSTPNLPIRYQLTTTVNSPVATLECICSTVMSEGGSHNLGILRHDASGAVASLSTGTVYALLGLRLKSAYIGASILMETISLIATSAQDKAHWELYFNPVVAGAFTYNDLANSALQVAKGAAANTVTGGIHMLGGYFDTSNPIQTTTENALRLGSAIDGTVDEIVLVVEPITNNITVHCDMTWRELI
jgi:hypothetical protein